MKPIDFRNETWADVQKRVQGQRLFVYQALLAHGPATTRALARAMQTDILTVRPRITELYQIGLCRLAAVPTANGGEGIYEAIPMAEVEARFAEVAKLARTGGGQLNLRLTA